jgi:LPXTG-motif cell wall-anchored protein
MGDTMPRALLVPMPRTAGTSRIPAGVAPSAGAASTLGPPQAATFTVADVQAPPSPSHTWVFLLGGVAILGGAAYLLTRKRR